MPRNWKRDAIIVKCSPDEGEHMYLDNCWNCAPWWYRVPICPEDRRKLTSTGFCRTCRGHFNTDHVYLLATNRGKETEQEREHAENREDFASLGCPECQRWGRICNVWPSPTLGEA